MHKTMEQVENICDIKNKLVESVCGQLNKGTECFPTEEGGAVVDMIKDLCDAEKNLWKAKYYETVVKAMEENGSEFPEEDDVARMRGNRAGYDNWRYSSGLFAPTGHGHFAGHGFTPMSEITRMYKDEKGMMENPRMGYVDPMNQNAWGPMMGYAGSKNDYSPDNTRSGNSRYGMNYDNYQDARRHYTETHNKEDKEKMDRHATEHIADTVVTIKEIWNQADPEMKKRMKQDLNSLMSMVNSTP